ncbi:ABC transporter permease [Cutibacterium sp.]|uniref:ABC transporter permease n=1 Tax=Cutibacterium sp. TaxID=1912221 RepID=UPI0026DB3E40|nr:ABC transporter permease [Cutibacterium sp.]MDO4412236.1 ABC transporter permease [Cutibacterium sp.]
MSNLLRVIGKRLIALPIMVLGVVLLVFIVMSFSPRDPAIMALGESASPEALEEYRELNGLNSPLIVRYGRFLAGMVHGDLGTSAGGTPVIDMVSRAFPITLQLTAWALLLAVIISLILGVIAALYRDRWPDQVIRVISIASLAIASFWLAILLVQAFGDIPGGSGAFPAVVSSWIPLSENPAAYFNSIALPVISLAIPVSGSLTRVVRTSVVEELDKDYVRTAIGSGIPYRTVVARNVLRNALINPLTVIGLKFGYAMGGAVVVEIIFNIKAMGQLILDGVNRNDVFLVQGVTLTVAIAFIVINIVVDLLYVLVNPRIRSV